MGVVTPVGSDINTFWDNITKGVSGIVPITLFDASAFDCRIAGEVRDFDPSLYFAEKKDARRADRFVQLAMGAATHAMNDAGFPKDLPNPERFGCIVGSGIGGLKTTEDQHTVYMEKGPGRLSPFMIPMLIVNMASGMISMKYGMQGPNFAPVSACATSAHAVGEAWRLIRSGDADVFVAGGSEAAIVPLGIGGFAAMKALSTRNDEPARASRPWDKDRDGFVMGEGAGIVVLEEYEHAKARGARIYCELAGFGASSDAFHMTAPSEGGEGPARCMAAALKDARVNPDQVGYLNAHGTSTPLGDLAETLAMKRAFGDHAHRMMVSSTKSMTGHLLGAAGGVEAIFSIMALVDGVVPPTINLDEPGEGCDLDYVPNVARDARLDVVMSNGFGFGGTNATLVFRRL